MESLGSDSRLPAFKAALEELLTHRVIDPIIISDYFLQKRR
jgi:hypothetical protein